MRAEKQKKNKNIVLIRRFLPYYKPYIGVFSLDLLCASVVGVSALLFPMLVRVLLNDGITENGVNMQTVLTIAGAILLLKIAEMFCNYYVAYNGHMMGVRMENDMRNKLYEHLQKLPYSFYDNTKIGHIMSRITTDLFDITEFAHHCPEELYIAFIKIIVGFIFLSTISFKLTLILFAMIPIMVVFAFYYNNKMNEAFRKRREQIAEINANVEDSLSGIRVVKSFANEGLELKKFFETSKVFGRIKCLSYKYMGIFHSGLLFFNSIMYLAVVVGGAVFISTGAIKATDLVAYLLYVSTLLESITSIIQFTEVFQDGITGFARYLELLETPIDIEDAPDAEDICDVGGSVEFDNVSFRYSSESTDVLSHLNLNVKKGTSIAIVGPSGSGKTTLCSLIPRFYEVSSGRILVDGHDIRSVTQKSLRSNIGVVQQDVYLFSGTIRENIAYGKPGATDAEIEEASRNAGAHDFILGLEKGYDTYVGERGIKLSGGQKQRISIARVFLKNPPILILDEATSSLDNESERIVQRSLDSLAKDRTTFVIAHRLSTIKNAEIILVLTDKGIEESGTHDELMKKNGVYSRLYEVYSNAFS